MRRVLLISFFFPPSNVVGAVRAAKLAKYLPACGWAPTVLTVDRFASRPETLALEAPAPRLIRARFVDPVGLLLARRRRATGAASAVPATSASTTLRGVLMGAARSLPGVSPVHVPDRAFPWYGPAVWAGLQTLRSEPYDAILSTAPPPTAHLVASTLAQITGVRWVADFRDLWSGNPSSALGPVRRRLEAALERRVLAPAQGLVTVSGPVALRLSALHGRDAAVVTNGFDPDETVSAAVSPEPRFTVCYTGSIYAGRQDPSPLLEGIARLRDTAGVTPDQLRVRFFGSEHDALPPLLLRYGVSDFVRLHGLVPRSEAVARQRAADALLVLDWNAATEQGVLTLKALEYLQARRPILLVGQRSDTLLARLLTEARVGHCCRTAAEVAGLLSGWLAQHRRRGQLDFDGDGDVMQRYSWPTLAGQMAAALAPAPR